MWPLWKLAVVLLELFSYGTPATDSRAILPTRANPVVNKVIRRVCATGEYYNLIMGCQMCSTVENVYQDVICPCGPYWNAVIGCKDNGTVSSFCTLRSSALKECSKRASSTTSSANSTAVPSDASVSNGKSTAFVAESTQPSFTTVIPERQSSTVVDHTSSTSSGGIDKSVTGFVVFVVIVLITKGCVAYFILRRPQTRCHQLCRQKTTDDAASELSEKAPCHDSVSSRAKQAGSIIGSADLNAEETDHLSIVIDTNDSDDRIGNDVGGCTP